MSSNGKAVVFIGGLGLLVFWAFFNSTGIKLFDKTVSDSKPGAESVKEEIVLTKPTITFVDPILGAVKPKITIVVFSDFRCPHCAISNKILREAARLHPQEVRVVWKDMPILPPLDLAWKIHQAARCAGEQGKFWEYNDLLFANQTGLDMGKLNDLAVSIGLDAVKFPDCLASGRTLPLVQRAYDEGRALQIDEVPFYFVNGEKYNGELTLEKIEEIMYGIK